VSGGILLATTIALRGATLIDGTGGLPVPDSLLIVSKGRVVLAGPATREALRAVPTGAATISLRGKWIVPGLIDAHVHAESDADLRQMLRWGVTAVRLMAEDVAASRALAGRASEPGSGMPDVFPAAPIFTAKGGWWDQGEPGDPNLNRFPESVEQAREAVRKAKRLGSDEIKLMLDDMAWCRAPKPPLPRMEAGIARALIEEARTQGLRASVHAPNWSDAKEAIEAGATALAHGILEPLGPRPIALMKTRAITYIPTMGVFEFLADTRSFVEEVLSDPVAVAGLPPATVARLRSAEYSETYRERYPNFESVKNRLPALRQNLLRLHAAGVEIALGTDMWAFPGLGVSAEMALYARAGLSPPEVLRAATQTAARSLAIDSDRGTLQAGKRADFLVLSGDPLSDVKNVRKILDVYKNGVRVGPPAAAAALE
jgi:imidazolonepropionase-like amidohydrolase